MALGPIIMVRHGAEELAIRPKGECGCEGPRCIFTIERRQVSEVRTIA